MKGARKSKGGGSYLVYRPGQKEPTKITSDDTLNADVRDGSLLILDSKGKVLYIFDLGQWITVNIEPVRSEAGSTTPKADERPRT